jgi:hypothetical protein
MAPKYLNAYMCAAEKPYCTDSRSVQRKPSLIADPKAADQAGAALQSSHWRWRFYSNLLQ